MKVEKDFEEFIRLLNYHKVKYLIVGAYALIYYTKPRNTGDIDFFIEASDLLKNKKSAGRTKDIADAEILQKFLDIEDNIT